MAFRETAICLADALRVQTLKPFRLVVGTGLAGVAVNAPPGSTTCRAILLSGTQPGIEDVSIPADCWLHLDELPLAEIAAAFQSVASVAQLIVPRQPLEEREGVVAVGPPNCWNDKSSLGFEEWSLGCALCDCYVCRCGSCFCNSPGGWNWKNQKFPARQGAPFDTRVRASYVVVAQFLLGNVRRRDAAHVLAQRSETRPRAVSATLPVVQVKSSKDGVPPIPIGVGTAGASLSRRTPREIKFAKYLIGLLDLVEKECGIRKGDVRKAIREVGAVAAARQMLTDRKQRADEIATLWYRERRELMIESVVVHEDWRTLFTEADRKLAEETLSQLRRA